MQKLNAEMFNLALAHRFPKKSPDQFVPEDGICPVCRRLLSNHPGVERAIAANGLTRVVTRNGYERVERFPAIPYCHCVETKGNQMDIRDRQSNLPAKAKTFETFEREIGTEAALDACLQFSIGKGPHILLLTGGAGCGKTHLLQSIGRAWLDAQHTVRYELVAELLDRLRASYNDTSLEAYDEAIRLCRQASVLLLDDIGLEKASDWVIEKITALVDERYRNGRRLVVATNKTRTQIANTMGFRLASRLWDTQPETVAVAHLTCPDYREK